MIMKNNETSSMKNIASTSGMFAENFVLFKHGIQVKKKHLPKQCHVFKQVLDTLLWIKDVEWLSVKTKVYLMML